MRGSEFGAEFFIQLYSRLLLLWAAASHASQCISTENLSSYCGRKLPLFSFWMPQFSSFVWGYYHRKWCVYTTLSSEDKVAVFSTGTHSCSVFTHLFYRVLKEKIHLYKTSLQVKKTLKNLKMGTASEKGRDWVAAVPWWSNCWQEGVKALWYHTMYSVMVEADSTQKGPIQSPPLSTFTLELWASVKAAFTWEQGCSSRVAAGFP